MVREVVGSARTTRSGLLGVSLAGKSFELGDRFRIPIPSCLPSRLGTGNGSAAQGPARGDLWAASRRRHTAVEGRDRG